MKKVLATIHKEWLLLKRDIAGLLLLLLMPSVLVIVMALVQDAPFKDYQQLSFQIIVADEEGGLLSKQVIRGLEESKNFKVITQKDGVAISDNELQKAILDGDYKVGITIPRGANAEVLNAANILANKLSSQNTAGSLPSREAKAAMQIRLYFDPTSSPTFRTALSFALDKVVTGATSSILVQRLQKLNGATTEKESEANEEENADDFQKAFTGIGIKEQVLGEDRMASNKKSTMNSVQHNVPAWAVFGMFFIVVPIAGHAIREREEGSALRLQLIPNSQLWVGLGKILFNAFVCLFQFAFMCAIGRWLLPYFGLPSLSFGASAIALLPLIFAIALAATSYGYFLGAVFKTNNQAMPFAAISIVILSALGGVWVPLDLLSPVLQNIALLSPLHWALDGIKQIMVRNNGISSIVLHIGVLLIFSIIMATIGLFQNKKMGHTVGG